MDSKELELVVATLADELSVTVKQVTSAIELLDAGNTIPFIARYRKEVTEGLDEIALRAIEDGIEGSRTGGTQTDGAQDDRRARSANG